MNLSQTILPLIYPKLQWSGDKNIRKVYLTFDDGPIPEITPWVLQVLNKYQVKATFFCIGDNIVKHPDIFQHIIAQGHHVANHTHNHLNGWNNPCSNYLENILRCQHTIEKYTIPHKKLFRPPYGKITRKQINSLLQSQYTIVMWSNLTKDYDKNISSQNCLKNTINQLSDGNIIVFHDSIKAQKNLYYTLPRLLDYLTENKYCFGLL